MARLQGSTNRGYALEKRPRASGKPWWRVVIVNDGKRQTVGTYETRTEANREGAKAVEQRERGALVAKDKITIAELFDQWLRDVAAPNVEPTTLEDYKATVHKHILPKLGQVRVQALTPARVRAFYSELRAAGVGARTIQLCHLRLAQALKVAVADGVVHRAVTDAVETPAAPSKRGDVWSMEEAQRFLAADVTKDDALSTFWQLAIETGMRKGELLGLRWRDVDVDRQAVNVRQTVTTLDGKAIIQERAKTDPSRRAVALTPEAVEALKQHRKAWAMRQLAASEWADHELVFCTDAGKPIHPSNVDRSFARLVKQAGVRRIRPHDLRHTAATHMLLNGVPVAVVSRQLGHANPGITLRIYAHVVGGAQEEAASVMSRLLRQRTG